MIGGIFSPNVGVSNENEFEIYEMSVIEIV